MKNSSLLFSNQFTLMFVSSNIFPGTIYLVKSKQPSLIEQHLI